MFLEHVNMTVSDVARTTQFYMTLLDLKVRWSGSTGNGQKAAHVGDDRCYLALFEADGPGQGENDYDAVGVNHFGFVVDNLDDAKARLAGLGVTPHSEQSYEPGRRLYFMDPDGFEVELVEYEGPR